VGGVVDGRYPVGADLDAPLRVARWRPWLAWILAIPHWVLLGIAGWLMGFLAFAGWLVALVTGRLPDGLAGVFAWYQRYSWRVLSYAAGLHEAYPPFELTFTVTEPGSEPATWWAPAPDRQGRAGVFFRWLLVLPHAFVLSFVYLGASVAWLAGAVAVLVTGRWPDGIRAFLVGTARWTARMNGYAYLLTDRYPPFSLD
jgi:hypothetical protein